MKTLLRYFFCILVCMFLLSCKDQAPVNYVTVTIGPGVVVNGASNVPKQPMIMLRFSTPVVPQTVNASTVQLYPSDVPAAPVALGDFIASNNLTSFSFRPIAPLQSDTPYTIAVNDGVKAQNGETLAKTTSFSFTTGDFTAPTVVLQNPIPGPTGISVLPLIQLHFSEAMLNVDSLHIMLHEGSPTGQAVQVGQIIEGAHNLYSMTPLYALNINTTYYITFDDSPNSAVTDLAGNALTPVTFSFTTGDYTAPTVNMTSPGNNAMNVTTSPSIQLQFSEPVTGVDSTTVTLSSPSVPSLPLHIHEVDDENYIITPDNTTLNESTNYYLNLGSGITDQSINHNPLAATSFQFTTGDFTAPTASIINPLDNSVGVALDPEIDLHFSEPVENVTTSTVSVHRGSATGTIVPISNISVNQDDVQSYAITLQDSLADSSPYYVVLTGGITDISLNHNSLAPTTFSFTTHFVMSQIATGVNGTCAIKSDGTVLCWGQPFWVYPSPSWDDVTSLAIAVFDACVVESDGTAICSGNISLDNWTGYTAISAGNGSEVGDDFACGLKNDGKVTCAGTYATDVPAGLAGVIKIATGAKHACALKGDGTVVCWGNVNTVPGDVNNVIAIASGYNYACAVKSNGTVECWGSFAPVVPANLNNVIAIAAGGFFTCALKNDGTVECWDGSGQTINVPAGLNDVVSLDIGKALNYPFFACALKNDGRVLCWGNDEVDPAIINVPVEFSAS